MKAVKQGLKDAGKSDEEIKEFETGASKFVKEKLIPNFKDFEFFTGESMNPDGMIALLNYREDGTTRASPSISSDVRVLNPLQPTLYSGRTASRRSSSKRRSPFYALFYMSSMSMSVFLHGTAIRHGI